MRNGGETWAKPGQTRKTQGKKKLNKTNGIRWQETEGKIGKLRATNVKGWVLILCLVSLQEKCPPVPLSCMAPSFFCRFLGYSGNGHLPCAAHNGLFLSPQGNHCLSHGKVPLLFSFIFTFIFCGLWTASRGSRCHMPASLGHRVPAVHSFPPHHFGQITITILGCFRKFPGFALVLPFHCGLCGFGFALASDVALVCTGMAGIANHGGLVVAGPVPARSSQGPVHGPLRWGSNTCHQPNLHCHMP